ncbi:ANTH domain-containing protein [Paraphysoderma sedebokerense]|nr:ANTH domain-containing protein [Paraphysoderma sedebokerense]
MTTTDRLAEHFVIGKSLFTSDLETAVIKATKRNSKSPKWKWVVFLLNATYRRDVSIDDLGRLLGGRLRDSSWNVVFKTLIITHILLDQGSPNRLIGYLASTPSLLNLSSFRDKSGNSLGIEQTKNIKSYAFYLEEKVQVYRETKKDFCRIASTGNNSDTIPRTFDTYGTINNERVYSEYGKNLRHANVDETFLRELEIVIRQLDALVKCKFFLDELDNNITLEAFGLLLRDLMKVIRVVTEGIVNMLERFFELPKSIARIALEVYKAFVIVSPKVTEFLEIAKKSPLRGIGDINLKLPPASLVGSLEEYINNPNSTPSVPKSTTNTSSSTASQRPATTTSRNPPPNQPSPVKKQEDQLIDLFGSIDPPQPQYAAQQVHNTSYQTQGHDYFGAAVSGGTNPFGASNMNMTVPRQPPVQQQQNNQFDMFDSVSVSSNNPFTTTTTPSNQNYVASAPLNSAPMSTGSNPFGAPSSSVPVTGPFGNPYKNQNNNPFGMPMTAASSVPSSSGMGNMGMNNGMGMTMNRSLQQQNSFTMNSGMGMGMGMGTMGGGGAGNMAGQGTMNMNGMNMAMNSNNPFAMNNRMSTMSTSSVMQSGNGMGGMNAMGTMGGMNAGMGQTYGTLNKVGTAGGMNQGNKPAQNDPFASLQPMFS